MRWRLPDPHLPARNRFRAPSRRGVWDLLAGFVSIAVMGVIALASGQPFVFPSLGPTAFLVFDAPLTPEASPRNALLGHLVGVVCAWLSLAVTGLLDAPSAVATGVTLPRAIAAGTSLGLTSAVMIWLGVRHPPACATTLIVGLGILVKPVQLLVLMLGVAVLMAIGVALNRLAGIPHPLWAAPAPATAAPAAPASASSPGPAPEKR